jgi:hypothetical protein
MCPYTFTVNFDGKITETTMTADGVLCGNCYAPSPDGMHLFEIDRLTKVLDSEGDPVSLIDITEVHSPDLPPYTVLVGNMYEFAPSGVTFDEQVRLTLGYNVDQLPADAVRVLMAFYGSEQVWTELNTESKQVADIGTLTGFFDHLTIFATLAEVPGFEVSDLSIEPSRREIWPFLTFAVVTGEEAVISVDVANVGNYEASHSVLLEVNGDAKANHEVSLAPGQIQQVEFKLTDNERGYHTVVIEDLTGEFIHSLWINWWLIIGIGAALIVIVVLAFFGVRWYRRRVS